MRDQQTFTIGILCVTATILLAAVLIQIHDGPEPALAIGQTDRGGDYILVTGQFTSNSEVLYITDAAARRLNVYAYDPTRRDIILWDTQDLGMIFGGRNK